MSRDIGVRQTPRRSGTILGGIAIAAVAAFGGHAAISSGDDAPAGASLAAERQAFAASIDENAGVDVAKRKLGVFRDDSARVGDGVERQKVIGRFPAEFAITDVRRVSNDLGLAIHVSAGRTICLSVRGPSRQGSDNCIPASGAAEGRPLVALDSIGGRNLVTAVVPDDVHRLSVATSRGREAVTPRHGVAIEFVGAAVSAVRFEKATGQSHEVDVSRDAG